MTASRNKYSLMTWGIISIVLTWLAWLGSEWIFTPLYESMGAYSFDYGHPLMLRTFCVGTAASILYVLSGLSLLVWGRRICRVNLNDKPVSALFWTRDFFTYCFTLLCVVFYIFVWVASILGFHYTTMTLWMCVPKVTLPLLLSWLIWERLSYYGVNVKVSSFLRKSICYYLVANIFLWVFGVLKIKAWGEWVHLFSLITFSVLMITMSYQGYKREMARKD